MLSFEQCFILFCSFPLLFSFVVGGLGFELCVFVAGWRHALRSEWPLLLLLLLLTCARFPNPNRGAPSPLAAAGCKLECCMFATGPSEFPVSAWWGGGAGGAHKTGGRLPSYPPQCHRERMYTTEHGACKATHGAMEGVTSTKRENIKFKREYGRNSKWLSLQTAYLQTRQNKHRARSTKHSGGL